MKWSPSEDLKKLFSRAGFIALAVFAIALQIQITLPTQGGYYGLRVSMADLFLPIVLGVIFLFCVSGQGKLPQWRVQYFYYWLILLAVVMTISLIRGYLSNGYWSSWALVNKYVGFYILCAYLFAGGWILTNIRTPQRAAVYFMGVFCKFFMGVLSLTTVLIFAQSFTIYDLWLPAFSWDGFMANRNAFMIIYVLVMMYLLTSRTELTFSPKLWMHHLFWFLLPIFCLYNASRTGWLAILFVAVVYFSKDTFSKIKVILPFLLLGVMLATVSFYTSQISMIEKKRQFVRLLTGYDLIGGGEVAFYAGDQQRYTAVEDGFDLYAHSNPVLGSGLGTYKEFQMNKRGEFVNLIDFTALWLLVETGALGLSAFAAFFIVCMVALKRSGWGQGDQFGKVVFLYLIMFAAMTVMHELMYSRFMWFILGMALVDYNASRKGEVL